MSEVNLPPSISNASELMAAVKDLKNVYEDLAKEDKSTPKDRNDLRLNLFFESVPSLEELTSTITKLEDILAKAPTLQLTLSDYPDDDFKRRLISWFRGLHPYCLVDIFIKPNIIGGFGLRDNRHIYDQSLATILTSQRLSKEMLFNNGS